MKKRILSLVLTALMIVSVFAFTSCEKETAYSLLNDAVDKMGTLDSLDVDVKANAIISMMGVNMEIPVEASVQANGMQGEDAVYSVDFGMSVPMASMTVNGQAYIAGDYVYLTVLDQNMKISIAEVMAYAGIEDITETEAEEDDEADDALLKELLADKEIVKNEDGTKTVAFEIPAETFQNIMAESAQAEDVDAATLDNAEFSAVTFEYTVNDDGYLTALVIGMEVSVKTEDPTLGVMDVTVGLDMDVTFNNPGEAVAVTPLEGYESFEEILLEDLLA